MEQYTIDPHMVPRWRLRNTQRRRSMPHALAWTGADEQREQTTTDPAAFAAHPERFTWFHDRIRGEVFVRDTRSPAERYAMGEDPTKTAPILPHRYMRHVEPTQTKAGLLGTFQAWRAGHLQAKATARWQPKSKGLD